MSRNLAFGGKAGRNSDYLESTEHYNLSSKSATKPNEKHAVVVRIRLFLWQVHVKSTRESRGTKAVTARSAIKAS